ncbi:MAG TPA: serine/threonine-protein kinase [Kofleriaceae bacterium]|nr:serine/threonine-protein kinase [Kofleriaceae bacterium]
MDCLSENTFQQLLDGTLVEARIRDTEVHLDTCRSCRELLSTLAQGLTESCPPGGEDVSTHATDGLEHEMPPGSQVGRFVVQSPLGIGGMGVVYAADDPVLGRKVALKLIHADRGEGPERAEWRARLLREARAIARLSHPNVITVHDIGLHGDHPFVAMELVEGTTLRSWLAASPRSWREVVPVFVAAGRGLLAAHRAGLVHRDFKPDNVLIGHDGRIRVTDFGLACPLVGGDRHGPEGPAPDEPAQALAALGSSAENRDERLTRTGTLVGTPGYIAPEVLRGGAADFASDQFSFCVALHEALFGQRPLLRAAAIAAGATDTMPWQLAVERSHAARARTDRHAVPGWLQQTVQRGLRAVPADRFPSMESLIAALDRAPIVRRRIQAGVAAVTVIAAVVIASVAAGNSDPEICTGGLEQVWEVWNPSVAVRVHSSFAATARPHAQPSADRVAERVGAYTDEWATVHRAACLATARGEQSPDLLDRRLSCMRRRLDQVAALLELFARRADGDLVDRAVDLIGKLEPLSTCADAAGLVSHEALPVGALQRTRVAALERDVDRAELERQAGRAQAAVDAARAVLQEQGDLQYAPLAAQAEGVLGRSLEDLGRIGDAREALGRAQRLAQRAGDPRLAVRLMLDLVVVVGVRQEHYGEAQLLAEVIEGALDRPELRGDEALRAQLLAALGRVATQERRIDRAVELQREVLAIRRRISPAISLEVASAEENLGIALRDKTLQDEARVHYFAALAIRRQLLGDHHPLVATVHINIGVTYLEDSNAADARTHLLAGLAILEAIPEHRSYHHALGNLGNLERSVGNHEQARRYHEAALAVRLRQLGPDHPAVAISLGGIGDALRDLGDFGQALAVHRRALAVFEKRAGENHPRYAGCLSDIGEDLRRLGDPAESLSYQRRALKIIRARAPDRDTDALLYEGLALVDLGRAREAMPGLESAYRAFSPGTSALRAMAAFGLARAISPHHPRSPRARELAQEARAIFTALHATRDRASVDAYLARAAR